MSTNPSLSTSQCTKFRGKHFEKKCNINGRMKTKMKNKIPDLWGDILLSKRKEKNCASKSWGDIL